MSESPQVKSFVSGALAKGMSRTELRTVLMNGGWPKDMVDGYLKRVTPAEPVVRSVILQVKGLRKKVRGGPLLDNLDFEIGKGEIFGIVGPGGSGKSTLMNILVGLQTPDTGDVLLVDGTPRSVLRDESVRASIGFSPQQPSLYADLSARENIEHFASVFGVSETAIKGKASQLLKLVGLDQQADQIVQSMSIGQKKRLDIACAMVSDPKIVFIDDPAGELDPNQQHELWRLLRDIADKGMTVVVASNFLADLESLCDRIGILRNGRITEIGKPDDLRVIYSHDFEIHLKTERQSYPALISMLTQDQQSGAKKITKQGTSLLVQTPNPQLTLRALLIAIEKQNDAIVSVEVMRPTIQEVFESLSSK